MYVFFLKKLKKIQIEEKVENEILRSASIVPLGHIPRNFLDRKILDCKFAFENSKNLCYANKNEEILLEIIVKKLLKAIYEYVFWTLIIKF